MNLQWSNFLPVVNVWKTLQKDIFFDTLSLLTVILLMITSKVVLSHVNRILSMIIELKRGAPTFCVTEKHYVSISFTRLWSVRKPLLFDTQNPGILGFQTAHAYKYKTKWQAKMKRNSRKMTFLLIYHHATLVLEKHRFVHRP